MSNATDIERKERWIRKIETAKANPNKALACDWVQTDAETRNLFPDSAGAHAGHTTPEAVAKDACDSILCECGNTPGGAGFYPCDAAGKELEPLRDGEWDRDGRALYVCDDCGAIYNTATTGRQVGQRPETVLATNTQ